MKVLFAWLLTLVLGFGAETVGWKVPLERLVEGGVKSPKMSRLEVAPAESVFFEEGDELWDLMEAIKIERWVPDDPAKWGKRDPGERKWGNFAGEWLVWNARSKQVVGRGGWEELEEIDYQLVHEQVRSTLVIEKNGQVLGSVVAVCGSGERADAKDEKLTVNISPNLSWDFGLIDLNYEVKIDMGEGRQVEVTSAASIRADRKSILGRWREGGDRYELIGSFEIIGEDGTLLKSVRKLEFDGRAVRLEKMGFDFGAYNGITLKNGLKVMVLQMAPDFVCRVPQPRPGSDFDFPPELKLLASEQYEDALTALKANGVSFDAKGSMALVHNSTRSLIAINDQENLDVVGKIAETINAYDSVSAHTRCKIEWTDQSRELLMRSGELAKMRQIRGGVMEEEFRAAPNMSRDEREVELSFSLEVPSKGVSLETSATMIDGVSLLVGEFGEKGVVLGVTIECEVIPEEQW